MSEAIAVEDGIKTYRGGSIESLLPQIRDELGADAVIVRQREGLIGGVGGFFQKRCVEVDARPGGPGVDVYDETPEALDETGGARVAGEGDEQTRIVRNDAATREGLATAAVQELVGQARPFADLLSEVDEGPAEVEVPVTPPRAKALRDGLVATGLGDDIARDVVDSVVASQLPFATPGRLRTLVRNELALRIPVAQAAGAGARTVVLVGPAGAGKTAAMAALAAAHEAAGTRVTRLETAADPGGRHLGGLLLVDTPPLWGGAAELKEVAAILGSLDAAEVHLVLRAGTAATAGAELVAGLGALGLNRLLVTGAGETGHLGGVLDVAMRAGLPLGYVAESAEQIAPADPRELAGRITP